MTKISGQNIDIHIMMKMVKENYYMDMVDLNYINIRAIHH